MAGDWIKLEHATPMKPEVLTIAEFLGVSRREALGMFVDYCVWLDQNLDESRNGLVTQVSRKSLEETLQCPGLSALLERIRWASFDDEARTMTVVNWERHNGNTAKTRAQGQRRAKRFRNAQRNDVVTQTALPEKRREEVRAPPSYSSNTQSSPAAVRATRLPPDWRLPDDWKDWAVSVHHLEPDRVIRISLAFRDFWIAKPGSRACKLDWFATWRNWIRKETQDA